MPSDGFDREAPRSAPATPLSFRQERDAETDTDHDSDRARADGGRHVVEREPAGAAGREFGRPENRL